MQYTVRKVPKRVDAALRRQAKVQGKSLNEVALGALAQAAGVVEPLRYRDLKWLSGSWVEDPEFDKILHEQRQIDPDLWK